MSPRPCIQKQKRAASMESSVNFVQCRPSSIPFVSAQSKQRFYRARRSNYTQRREKEENFRENGNAAHNSALSTGIEGSEPLLKYWNIFLCNVCTNPGRHEVFLHRTSKFSQVTLWKNYIKKFYGVIFLQKIVFKKFYNKKKICNFFKYTHNKKKKHSFNKNFLHPLFLEFIYNVNNKKNSKLFTPYVVFKWRSFWNAVSWNKMCYF